MQKILEGKDLKAGAIVPFTEEETDEMLKKVLTEKSKGMSVRRAIRNLCGGDEKLMLRMQNKYRNLLKKQPERVRRAADRFPAGTAENSSEPNQNATSRAMRSRAARRLPISRGTFSACF